jgi:lysozyme
VSVYQGPNVSWPAVHASGRAFGIARINDSVHPLDPTFESNYRGVRAAGMVPGSYQFMRPSSDPVAQARTAIAALRLVGFAPGVDLPPALDVERADGMDDPNGIASAMLAWIGEVEKQLEVRPLIYAGAFFAYSVAPRAAFARYPLWSPAYGVKCGRVCLPWSSWTFWQYSTAHLPGVPAGADHDVFRGDLDAFRTFVASTKIAPCTP